MYTYNGSRCITEFRILAVLLDTGICSAQSFNSEPQKDLSALRQISHGGKLSANKFAEEQQIENSVRFYQEKFLPQATFGKSKKKSTEQFSLDQSSYFGREPLEHTLLDIDKFAAKLLSDSPVSAPSIKNWF